MNRSPRASEVESANRPRLVKVFQIAAALYALLIVYSSLYPLTGWSIPATPAFSFLTAPATQYSKADLLTNVLAYVPLGSLLTAGRRRGRFSSIALAAFTGAALSLLMETLQTFLPDRVASNIDLAYNFLGSLIGACIGATLRDDAFLSPHVKDLRRRFLVDGPGAELGLLAALTWMASQLSPFVPSIDASGLRDGLHHLKLVLIDPRAFDVSKSAVYALDLAGLALVASVISCKGRRAMFVFMLVAGMVLCGKLLIVTRGLSPESLVGLVMATIIVTAAPRKVAVRALLSATFMFSGYIVAQWTPAAGPPHAFGWIPFVGQLDKTVDGFGSILETAWPSIALASITVACFGVRLQPMLAVGLLAIAATAAFEWSQRYVPGRYGESTPVVIVAMTWILACLFAFARRPVAEAAGSPGNGARSPPSRRLTGAP